MKSLLGSSEWFQVLSLLPLSALLSAILGGAFTAWFSLLLFVYLCWHLYHLVLLFRWLNQPGTPPPNLRGLWRNVFDLLYRQDKEVMSEKRRLQRQIDRFVDSSTALPDATVILGRKGNIEWFNDAAERFLGLQRPRDYNQRIDNLIRHPVFIQYLNNTDYDKTVEIPSPIEEHLHLRVRLVPYGNQQRLLLARDVTRLHHLEQMRRDFIANISHELKTPLTVITGVLETLQSRVAAVTEDTRRPMELMREQSTRMLRIINDLLFLSKLETATSASKKSLVDVPVLLQTLREDAIGYSGAEQHRIELDVNPALKIRGNESELYSAFSNLLINAIKYTPPQGLIYLRWFYTDEGACFQVDDNGLGIATHHIPRLTERFYRVDAGRSRERGGTGLGLAIVKHVLIRHNAQLKIESTLKKGSRFTCVFPRSLIEHPTPSSATLS